MADIQKHQPQSVLVKQRENWLIANHLDAYQQKLVKFFEAPAVNVADAPTLKKIIDSAISSALQDLGKLIENDEDVEYMVEQLHAFLLDRYPSIRLTEIKTAFQRGVAKEYGEYYGFNTATLKIFIQRYMADEQRAEALKKFMALKQKSEIVAAPTDEEKEALATQIILDAFETFKKTGWYQDFNNVVFATIRSRNESVFEFTDEQIIGFYKTAKHQVLCSYHVDKGISFFEARNKKARIKEIQSLDKFSKVVKDAEIITEANRVALNFVFKRLLDAGKGVEGLC